MRLLKIIGVTTAVSAVALAGSIAILLAYQAWGFFGAAPFFILGVSLVVWAEER